MTKTERECRTCANARQDQVSQAVPMTLAQFDLNEVDALPNPFPLLYSKHTKLARNEQPFSCTLVADHGI